MDMDGFKLNLNQNMDDQQQQQQQQQQQDRYAAGNSQMEQVYANFAAGGPTPDPSPTSSSFSMWSGYASSRSGDIQAYLPDRVMTSGGNELWRMGTPANSMFTEMPHDFRNPTSTGGGNFMAMPPASPSNSQRRRQPPSVRMGLSRKTPTKYAFCVFCKNNEEDESWYMNHTLKDDAGRITCPVLFNYTCPFCQASGPISHTMKYCPLNKGDKFHEKEASITDLKSMRTSTGRIRNSKTGGPNFKDDFSSVLTPIGTPMGSPIPQQLDPSVDFGNPRRRPLLGAGGSISPMPGELVNNQRRQGQPMGHPLGRRPEVGFHRSPQI